MILLISGPRSSDITWHSWGRKPAAPGGDRGKPAQAHTSSARPYGRTAERSGVLRDVLAQPEKRQDREDDHDHADDVDDVVHEPPLRAGSRLAPRAPRDALHTNACGPL